MSKIEIILFWITIFVYAGSFAVQLFSFVSQKPRAIRGAILGLWIGWFFHTATGIARWIAGNHPPVTDTYELNLTGTWVTVLVFLLFEKWRKLDHSIGLWITPLVFLILGHGFVSRTDAIPMGPAYQSPWLVIHVIFAWLGFSCYAISTGAAILLLLNQKFPDWKPNFKIPPPAVLDLTSYRFVVLGFINHAVMLVAGAIWAKKLWGRYWSWDALETWSLIAFLFYALYLHLRSFLNWKMSRAAWLSVVGLIFVAISFWGVGWFSPSPHPGP